MVCLGSILVLAGYNWYAQISISEVNQIRSTVGLFFFTQKYISGAAASNFENASIDNNFVIIADSLEICSEIVE